MDRHSRGCRLTRATPKTDINPSIISLGADVLVRTKTRGRNGINETAFIDIICKLSALAQAAPEIAEMDINPLMGS